MGILVHYFDVLLYPSIQSQSVFQYLGHHMAIATRLFYLNLLLPALALNLRFLLDATALQVLALLLQGH